MLLRWCLPLALCYCLASAQTLKELAERHRRYVDPDGESSGDSALDKKSLLDTLNSNMDDVPDIDAEAKEIHKRYVDPDGESSGDSALDKKSLLDTLKSNLDDVPDIDAEAKEINERYVEPDASGDSSLNKKSLDDTNDAAFDDTDDLSEKDLESISVNERYVEPEDGASGDSSLNKKSLDDTNDADFDDTDDLSEKDLESVSIQERYVAGDNGASGDQSPAEKSLDDTDQAELDDTNDIDWDTRSLSEPTLDLGRRQSDSKPTGMDFIGVAYDLLKGNPDGGRSHNGGIDPGVKSTRKHLKLTYSSCLADGPEEVEFAVRSSCVNETVTQIFHGTRSYQRKFSIDVTTSASGRYGLANFAFSASFRYGEAEQQTINTKSIMRDEHTVCNRGRIRVKTELAEAMKYSVDNSFAAAVCALPVSYNKARYMAFISEWGTHTIFQIELGNKIIHRAKTSLKQLFEYAMQHVGASVSASGSYASHSGSLSLDIDSVRQSSSFDSNFQRTQYTFTLGNENDPQPIGLKLEPLPVILTSIYWQKLNELIAARACPSGTTYDAKIKPIRTNVERALREYPAYLSAKRSTDLPFKIPRVWPMGSYSLVQPNEGCPSRFHSGSRFHDTEDSNPANYYGHPMYLKKVGGRNDLRWWFCTKTEESEASYALPWPKGEYCVMKKGNCPTGFTQGFLRWDDEDSNNRNSYEGTRPDGSYGRDTEIYFCCREDGFSTNPIYLPIDKPFILLRKNRHCQQVHNMRVYTLERQRKPVHTFGQGYVLSTAAGETYIRWDDEDSRNNDRRTGLHPFDDGGSKDHRLWFCYYKRS